MKCRDGTAGVTLIEMLVVLTLIGVLSSAVALGLTPRTSGNAAELAAIRLSADLERAIQYALDHQRGFGVKADTAGYSFWLPSGDGWQPHADPLLRDVKPFSGPVRILVQDHDSTVFAVSRYLVPEGSTPWQATLRQGAFAQKVIFDGITARIVQTAGD